MDFSPNQWLLPRKKIHLSENNLTSEQKTWIGYRIARKLNTAKDFFEKYYLGEFNLLRYARNYKLGKISRVNGQPRRIDLDVLKDNEEFITSGPLKNYKKNVPKNLNKLAARIFSKRTGLSQAQSKPLSNPTIRKFRKELGLKEVLADQKTDARLEAEADLTNTLTFMAANNYMVPNTHPSLVLNVDGTQFKVGDSCEDKPRVWAKNKKKAGIHLKPISVPKGKGKGITAYFIKYYMLMSSAGFTAPPIYIIANEDMPKESM